MRIIDLLLTSMGSRDIEFFIISISFSLSFIECNFLLNIRSLLVSSWFRNNLHKRILLRRFLSLQTKSSLGKKLSDNEHYSFEDTLSVLLVIGAFIFTMVALSTPQYTFALIYILGAISFGLLFIGFQVRGLKK